MNPSEERFGDGESSNLEEELEGDMSTDASTVQLPKSPEPGDTPTMRLMKMLLLLPMWFLLVAANVLLVLRLKFLSTRLS